MVIGGLRVVMHGYGWLNMVKRGYCCLKVVKHGYRWLTVTNYGWNSLLLFSFFAVSSDYPAACQQSTGPSWSSCWWIFTKLGGNVTLAKISNLLDSSGATYGITGNMSQNVQKHIKFNITKDYWASILKLRANMHHGKGCYVMWVTLTHFFKVMEDLKLKMWYDWNETCVSNLWCTGLWVNTNIRMVKA